MQAAAIGNQSFFTTTLPELGAPDFSICLAANLYRAALQGSAALVSPAGAALTAAVQA